MNRAVVSENSGELYDIICGTAFICDCSGETFESLSEEDLEEFLNRYLYPEVFIGTPDGFTVVKVNAEIA